jgi:hypothetical protein
VNVEKEAVRVTQGRFGLASSIAIGALCWAVCAVSSATALGGHGQRVPCGPIRAQTVVADSAARVYRLPTGHVGRLTLYDYDGCTVGAVKSQQLVTGAFNGDRFDPGKASRRQDRPFSCKGTDCTWVRGIRLAGARAGIIAEHYGLDSTHTVLTVRDLAGGHLLHSVQTYSLSTWVGTELIKYVLAASGNVAWSTISGSWGPDQPSDFVGIIHRAIGRTVITLDSAPGVRTSSLRLRGETVVWIDDGQRRSAPLS